MKPLEFVLLDPVEDDNRGWYAAYFPELDHYGEVFWFLGKFYPSIHDPKLRINSPLMQVYL